MLHAKIVLSRQLVIANDTQFEYEKKDHKVFKTDKWVDARGRKIEDDHPNLNLVAPPNWEWGGKKAIVYIGYQILVTYLECQQCNCRELEGCATTGGYQ